jgi:hypothetical protein
MGGAPTEEGDGRGRGTSASASRLRAWRVRPPPLAPSIREGGVGRRGRRGERATPAAGRAERRPGGAGGCRSKEERVGAREEEAAEPREMKHRVSLRLGSSAGLEVVPCASAGELGAGSPKKGAGPPRGGERGHAGVGGEERVGGWVGREIRLTSGSRRR